MSLHHRRFIRAFTLVEALIVISILGVLAALAVAAFSNAAQDTRRVVARQQQAQVQNAVNAWVSANATRNVSMKTVRDTYNEAASSFERLELVSGYLDASTLGHFSQWTTNSAEIKSDAMSKLDLHLELPDWAGGSYPQVELK